MKYIFLVLIFIFASCSSKKYFEPEKFAKSIQTLSDFKQPATLIDTTSNLGTFDNGLILSSSNHNFKLPNGFKAIGGDEENIVATNGWGLVKVFSRNTEIYSYSFEKSVVSASYKNTFLALVFTDNTIILFDTVNDSQIFSKKLPNSLAINAKIVAPKFLNKIVIFPTLDGRLFIVDLLSKSVVQDIHLSDKAFFNNIIFLKTYEDRLVAASSNKIITIKDEKFLQQTHQIKEVLINNNFIYILCKDAEILKLNLQLEKVSSIKLPYANFSSAIFHNDKLFVLEKQGYLVQLDEALNIVNISQINEKIDSHVFMSDGKIFYKNRVYLLQNI